MSSMFFGASRAVDQRTIDGNFYVLMAKNEFTVIVFRDYFENGINAFILITIHARAL